VTHACPDSCLVFLHQATPPGPYCMLLKSDIDVEHISLSDAFLKGFFNLFRGWQVAIIFVVRLVAPARLDTMRRTTQSLTWCRRRPRNAEVYQFLMSCALIRCARRPAGDRVRRPAKMPQHLLCGQSKALPNILARYLRPSLQLKLLLPDDRQKCNRVCTDLNFYAAGARQAWCSSSLFSSWRLHGQKLMVSKLLHSLATQLKRKPGICLEGI